MRDQEQPYTLQIPIICEDDVRQEAELLRLQGKNPSARLIRMRLEGQMTNEQVFSGDLGAEASPVFLPSPVASHATISALVQWACDQGDAIQEQILTFLDDPSEESLGQTLRALGYSEERTHERPTLSSALRRALHAAPCSKDDLYALARSVHQSKRPEAAVRQFLRSNQIPVNPDGLYYLGGHNE